MLRTQTLFPSINIQLKKCVSNRINLKLSEFRKNHSIWIGNLNRLHKDFKFFLAKLSNLVVLWQIGWIYGSVTEDILTGFKMHCRGWRSIYCMPHRPAFKGSAPINLSDRLNQVLRWALGSVEICLSRHCPIWYGYSSNNGGGKLKCLERLAYINTTVYPLTSLPLLAYCVLPAVCLLTGKFIIPTVCIYFKIWVSFLEIMNLLVWFFFNRIQLVAARIFVCVFFPV